MQNADFKNKSGLCDFDSNVYYSNAIKKITKKFNWLFLKL